jgi:murein DD-endopeptidase MepM/ murein hydrolase activator NlpD
MPSKKITSADVAALGVSVARAFAGNLTGLAMQIPKWIKPLIGIVGGFLFLLLLLITMPLMLLGQLVFPDSSTAHGQFIESELQNTDEYIAQFSSDEEKRYVEAEAIARRGVSLGEYDNWSSNSDVDVAFNQRVLLILYNVQHGGYDNAPMDFGKFKDLHLAVIDRKSGLNSSTHTGTKWSGRRRETYTYTNYQFNYEAKLKPFPEMLDALGFTDVQKALAYQMLGLNPEEPIYDPALGYDSSNYKSGATFESADGTLDWPTPGYSIGSGPGAKFGMRMHPILKVERMHKGIDVPAPSGAPILSAGAGTVTIAKYSSSYGNYVVVDHGNGHTTLYAHMSSMSVSVGQSVSTGDVLGAVGSTGLSTGAHLHYEVRVNGTPVDPMEYYVAK